MHQVVAVILLVDQQLLLVASQAVKVLPADIQVVQPHPVVSQAVNKLQEVVSQVVNKLQEVVIPPVDQQLPLVVSQAVKLQEVVTQADQVDSQAVKHLLVNSQADRLPQVVTLADKLPVDSKVVKAFLVDKADKVVSQALVDLKDRDLSEDKEEMMDNTTKEITPPFLVSLALIIPSTLKYLKLLSVVKIKNTLVITPTLKLSARYSTFVPITRPTISSAPTALFSIKSISFASGGINSIVAQPLACMV